MNRLKTEIGGMILLIATAAACCSGPAHFNDTAEEKASKPDEVIGALELKPGAVVADIGAGGGFFTVKLARAVGETGKVHAVDISRENLDYVKKYVESKNVKNVTYVLARADNSMLAAGSTDLVFMRNTYHHIENRPAYFAGLKTALKPGGKVAIIDYKSNLVARLHGHYTDLKRVLEEMKSAGYRIYKTVSFLEKQSFVIFIADDAR